MRRDGIAVSVEEPGLPLSKDKPYLGASLDRVVTMIDTGKKWGMEVKSPLSKAGMTVDEACKAKNFCLEKLADGSVTLKRNHNYFCQGQGQVVLGHCTPWRNIFCSVLWTKHATVYWKNPLRKRQMVWWIVAKDWLFLSKGFFPWDANWTS